MITAPLLTISTSMQCSIPSKVVTIQDFKLNKNLEGISYRARTGQMGGKEKLGLSYLNVNDK